MIIPLFSGIIIDRIGLGKSIIGTSFISTFGSLVIAFGAYHSSFNTLLAGRIIFGIGTESLYIVNMLNTTEWFFDQEFSLAMGLSSSIPTLFASLAGLLVPYTFHLYGLGFAMSMGAGLCVISTFASVFAVILVN